MFMEIEAREMTFSSRMMMMFMMPLMSERLAGNYTTRRQKGVHDGGCAIMRESKGPCVPVDGFNPVAILSFLH